MHDRDSRKNKECELVEMKLQLWTSQCGKVYII